MMKRYKQQIESALETVFRGSAGPHETVYRAMRYALSAGGKRIRPVLTLGACEACGGTAEEALPFACAVEMIHTYSLIHDDLPCMDDDDFRRGKPSCHKAFGEAEAVLAGDGLLTLAFETVTKAELPAERIVSAVRTLAELAGAEGMIGGQIVDMESEHKEISEETLSFLHRHKTGALLRAAVLLGGIAAGVGEEELSFLNMYGDALGLAFQIQDDILDVTGTTSFGKPIGSDEKQGKTTFVTMFGIERASAMANHYTEQAVLSAEKLQHSEFFVFIARQLAERKK